MRLSVDLSVIKFVYKKIQSYVLLCHNLRTKYAVKTDSKPSARRPSVKVGRKGNPHDNRGNSNAVATGEKKLRKINSYFKSDNNAKNVQMGINRSEAVGLGLRLGTWTVLGTVAGPSILPISTLKTHEFGKRRAGWPC